MYIIPQQSQTSTNEIIKFDKKLAEFGYISICSDCDVKLQVSNSRLNVAKKAYHGTDLASAAWFGIMTAIV